MTHVPTINKHPVASSEVAAMLGMPAHDSGETTTHTTVNGIDLPVDNLPLSTDPIVHHDITTLAPATTIDAKITAAKPQSTYLKFIKVVLPFVAVFIVGLFLYYFFFSTLNFGNLIKTTPKASAPQQTALGQLEQQNLASYKAWASGYYYEVTDAKILDPETDNSGNGLSNFEKYLLNLNPKSYDTLGLGMADSQALAMGINPLSGGQLTDNQKDIIAKYIDMEVVQNRLALYNLQHPAQVAGAGITAAGAPINSFNPRVNNSVTSSAPIIAPVTTPVQNNNSVDINTAIPGHLDIPDLNIAVPIIWSGDPNNFEKDLQVGVVHYPGTALPGQIGTTYIAGHSSNYVWAKGDYNKIFSKLGDLKNNASFSVSVTDKNGKLITYHYVVTKTSEFAPTDQAQFANSGKSVVALSTCWPVGSTAKRLVVFGELTQVEK